MGVKKTNKYHLINNGSMTGTSVITSSTQDITNFDNIGLQVSWTGSAVGTLEVLSSIDNSNFIPLTFNPALTQPAGSSGSYLVDLNQVPYPYLQVKYTNASSTGTLNVHLSSKDVN